jgi:hypothetical protein
MPVVLEPAKISTTKSPGSVSRRIELKEIYLLTPKQIEPYFQKWAKKWSDDGNKDINNPKIPLTFVRNTGKCIYSPTQTA